MPACERPVTHLNVGLRHLDADRLLLGCRIALTVNEVCLLCCCHQRVGRHRYYATACRARCSRLLLGHTDWPVELLLDGGPGGSDAVGALARDVDRRLAGSESGSDTEPSVSVCACVSTLWVIICRSMLARSREIWKLARSREKRR